MVALALRSRFTFHRTCNNAHALSLINGTKGVGKIPLQNAHQCFSPSSPHEASPSSRNYGHSFTCNRGRGIHGSAFTFSPLTKNNSPSILNTASCAVISSRRNEQDSVTRRSMATKSSKSTGKKTKKKKKPSNKTHSKKQAKHAMSQQSNVPHAYLSSTASPNAWIATCAADELNLDRSQLFHQTERPKSFQNCKFDYMSPKLFNHELPNYPIPEVAFLGRSNVGKSSLINALMQRKDLARVSKSPGRTQQVNYFGLMKNSADTKEGTHFPEGDVTGFLVDLPGFGYAKAPDKKVDQWQKNTMDFLLNRHELGLVRKVYFLIDARHGMLPFETSVMGWFDDSDIPYTIVFTKSDCVSQLHLIRYVNEVCMRYHSQLFGGYGCMSPIVHLTSSKKKIGIGELMWGIDGDFGEFYWNMMNASADIDAVKFGEGYDNTR